MAPSMCREPTSSGTSPTRTSGPLPHLSRRRPPCRPVTGPDSVAAEQTSGEVPQAAPVPGVELILKGGHAPHALRAQSRAGSLAEVDLRFTQVLGTEQHRRDLGKRQRIGDRGPHQGSRFCLEEAETLDIVDRLRDLRSAPAMTLVIIRREGCIAFELSRQEPFLERGPYQHGEFAL